MEYLNILGFILLCFTCVKSAEELESKCSEMAENYQMIIGAQDERIKYLEAQLVSSCRGKTFNKSGLG